MNMARMWFITAVFLGLTHQIIASSGGDEESLQWSKDLCSQLGDEYANLDYCGEIIGCTGADSKEKGRYLRNSSRSSAFGWRLPGSSTCAWPGPLIRVERGTSYGLFVKGNVDKASWNYSMHLHGLHISSMGNGDDVRRRVAGSDVIFYNVTIPADHMGGTYWYHTHSHGQSYHEMKNGAFGMLIVEDGDFGSVDAGVQKFMQNEQHLVVTNMLGLPGKFEASKTHLEFVKDEWYRLRVLTMSLDSHQGVHTLSFDHPVGTSPDSMSMTSPLEAHGPCEIRTIAHDGILKFKVPSLKEQNSYTLNGASRIDFAIRCTSEADIIAGGKPVSMIKIDNESYPDKSISPFEGGIESESGTWSSRRPYYLRDLRNEIVNSGDSWTIKMGEHDINGYGYSTSERLCNDDHPNSKFIYNHVNEWYIKPSMHPVHVHVHPMQVVSEGGCDDYEEGEFFDTIMYRNDYKNPRKPPCKVRLRFADFGGLTAIHCHMPQHEDQGAMGVIFVEDGPTQPDYPRVYKCATPPCDEPVDIPLVCAK